ncbi:MAG TPA: glycosyltransferase [Patescibacteria group bacterium]|nr:glycosyltransferase [Patescibacteria group bacterium]
MKIAIFTDSYYPMLNGVTVSIDNLTHELRALGHSVYIFAPKFDDYVDTDPHVYRLKAFKVVSSEPEVHMPVVLPHKLVKEVQRHDFDIIHAHGNGFFSLLGYQVAKVKGVPFVMAFHTELTRYMHYVFNGRLITPHMAARAMRVWGNISDYVVTPSTKMKKELIAYGVKKPIAVIPNFVYAERFKTTKRGFLHDAYNIPTNSPILLSVGRLGREKNFPFLLRAFEKVAEKQTKVHLVIVGGGEEAQTIQNYAQKLKAADRIHFAGKIEQKNIPLAYADADIFVFASRTETQGVVMLEAASAGLPFVVVKDGAYEHIIISGENGYQVAPQTQAFADSVLELLQNSTQRKAFGKKSKQLVDENFSPQNLAKDMINLYQLALLKHKKRRITLKKVNKVVLARLYHTTGFFSRIFQ